MRVDLFSTELHFRSRQVFFLGLGLFASLLLAVPGVAQAKGGHELPSLDDPLPRPKAVYGRNHVLAGKNDIGVFGAMNINPKLTNHYGGALSYARYFNEYFAVELLLGGGYGGVSGLGNEIRYPSDENRERDMNKASATDLSNTGALLGLGQLGLRFTPFYGKINLASELPLNVAMYFVGGLGGAFVSYESMQACSAAPVESGGKTVCQDGYLSRQVPTFAFSSGVGLRIYLGDFAIRTEYRSVFFPDSYRTGINQKDPVGTPGEEASDAGLTHTPMLFVGGSYAF